MTLSRRAFIKVGTGTTLAAAIPRWLWHEPAQWRQPAIYHAKRFRDPDTRELAHRAIDAAMAAGATYVDVRLGHDLQRDGGGPYPVTLERMTVGVRALVDGCWGFTASPDWTADEMVRLGQEAAFLARTNAAGPSRVVILASPATTESGGWQTPMQVDPFTVPLDEMHDFLAGFESFAVDALPRVREANAGCAFRRENRVFSSSEGAFITQSHVKSYAEFKLVPDDLPSNESGQYASAGRRIFVSGGWEHVQRLLGRDEESLMRLLDELRAEWRLPWKPVEVGRYDVVLDAESMAAVLDGTLGSATELDRALGYEANAGGTSYLDDPASMLGSFVVASPVVSVTGNRSEPTGLATVAWDDEGVRPEDFTLVKSGVLEDFQTTRESASWLSEAYAKAGRTVRSHACSSAESGLDAPLAFPPNLRLEPAKHEATLDDLVAGLEQGILIRSLDVDTDFQALNGWSIGGKFYQVRHGKVVARIRGASLLFRGPEFWKAVTALGGAKSLEWHPMMRVKGEPAQQVDFSIGAAPGHIKEQSIIDAQRRA